MAENAMYAPDVIKKNLAIGTAENIIEKLKGCESMGYSQYSFWIDRLMPFERKKASLERFIRDVMPAFS